MITIIDYGMGNLGSIKNILKKIGYPSIITSDKKEISSAEKIILPGVGSFDKAMINLAELDLISAIKQKASEGIPFLGICLGMQLLSDGSEEGTLPGLGLIPGLVKKFTAPSLKVPHMGWNVVTYKTGCPLYAGFDQFEETRFYFVHSYYYEVSDPNNSSAVALYGKNFCCSVQKENVQGVQFHPEKSHKYGMSLLKNFIELI